MKVVLQRVTHAQVTVEEQVVGKIGHGFLLLLGVEDADTVETADRMVEKICKLRIFQDEVAGSVPEFFDVVQLGRHPGQTADS